MVIVSVKGAELSPDSRKLKARIVCRGDNMRDERGMSAVFDDELYSSSPSSLEGLNTTIALGLWDSHGVSVSDAIKAYVQSELKSPTHTYVMLPPKLVPEDRSLRAALQSLVWTSIVLYILVLPPGLDPQMFRRSGVSQPAFCLLLSAFVFGSVRLRR